MLSSEDARKIVEDILEQAGNARDGEPGADEKLHPADIASAIDQIERDESKLEAFHSLDLDAGSEVLPLLNDQTRELILQKTDPEMLGDLIGEMDSDDAADILGDIDEQKAEDILDTVPEEVDHEVSMLMEYPEESAGGIMQTELVSVPGNFTVAQAIDKLRANASQIGEVHNLFVVGEGHRLEGVLPLSQLILNPGDKTISDLARGHPLIYAKVGDDQENVAELFKRYDMVSVPVVDDDMTLVGRILIDDIVDVIEEEVNEDIMIMAGAADEALVQTHSVMEIVGYRLPWLSASLVGGFLTGMLIWQFKLALAEALSLVAFIPLIMGMGGNVGTQSSAIVIRGMATGKLAFGSLTPYLYKELKIGAALGLVCGVMAAVASGLWHGSTALGLIVGLSIFMAIFMAALLGALVPLFFRWAKIDPAIAGGPIVLAINDISGLLIFFGVATVLLGYLK